MKENKKVTKYKAKQKKNFKIAYCKTALYEIVGRAQNIRNIHFFSFLFFFFNLNFSKRLCFPTFVFVSVFFVFIAVYRLAVYRQISDLNFPCVCVLSLRPMSTTL